MSVTKLFLSKRAYAFAALSILATSPVQSAFLDGGIGVEERAAVVSHTKEFPLRIAFSEGPKGAYVADVTLGIYDSEDKLVLFKKATGPIALVNLPDGEYKVVAIYQGEKRSHIITLNSSENQRIYFNWPSAEQQVLED